MQNLYKMRLEEWVGFTLQHDNKENNEFRAISRDTAAGANERTL